MTRVFYEKPLEKTSSNPIILEEDDSRHLKALRHRDGDIITVSDNQGSMFHAKIIDIEKRRVPLILMDHELVEKDSEHPVTLYQALLKGEKNEYLIQKCTELGISKIVFYASLNCVAKFSDSPRKLERWRKVAKMAAMQCGRAFIPEIEYIGNMTAAMKQLKKSDSSVLFYEHAFTHFSSFLNKICRPPNNFLFFVGPEGGFTSDEAADAVGYGCQLLSLGPRILRAETASVAALSAYRLFTREM